MNDLHSTKICSCKILAKSLLSTYNENKLKNKVCSSRKFTCAAKTEEPVLQSYFPLVSTAKIFLRLLHHRSKLVSVNCHRTSFEKKNDEAFLKERKQVSCVKSMKNRF